MYKNIVGLWIYLLRCKQEEEEKNNEAGQFDLEDFKATMKYTDDDVVDTVAHQMVNQYLCSIRRLVKEQYEQGLITMRVEDIMTTKMNDLIHIVKNRGEITFDDQTAIVKKR